MSSKQIVRLVAGPRNVSCAGPPKLAQWIFAPAGLQGLPTPGALEGVGHRFLWWQLESGYRRTARSATRAFRDSAWYHEHSEWTSTDASTSVVSCETRCCSEALPFRDSADSLPQDACSKQSLRSHDCPGGGTPARMRPPRNLLWGKPPDRGDATPRHEPGTGREQSRNTPPGG